MEDSGHKLTLDKVITTRQWKRIFRELEYLKSQNSDFYICTLTWMTGLRVSEVINLKWNDIDLDDEFLKVREGKGSKDRTVYFGPKVRDLLIEFKSLNHHFENEYIFKSRKKCKFSRVTIHRRFKEILRRGGLPSCLSFHSLRHGYATRMLDEGIQLHELKTQLGHASIATTAVYLHFTESSRKKFSRVC